MQRLQRWAAVLVWPAIAWLGTGCDQTQAPQEPERPGPAYAMGGSTTRWVNDDDPNGFAYMPPGTSCNNPGYQTISLAVSAAASGDKIRVCPGTYVEEVNIPAGKDNLELRSEKRWEAIIKAPALMLGPTKAIVRVNGAQNVSILAFTITGPGGGPCDALRYGVRVDNDGSADILGNHITDIRDALPPPAVSGCQNGVGIQVGRQFEVTTGSARIIGNVIENYQKNGMTIDNAGSSAEIRHNRVLGVGPTATIAQNGIQASRDATAEIEHNFIAQHIYTLPAFASSGIILFQSGKVVTNHNTATANDVSIWMIETGTGSVTDHNRARASTFDGIAVDGGPGSQVNHNHTERNGGPGIGLYLAMNNALDHNKVEDNVDSGILLFDADQNLVEENQIKDNGTSGLDNTDGIRVEMTSSDNTIRKNHLKDNVTHDCHDESIGTGTSGTANFWIDNHGETENAPGLCTNDAPAMAFETTTYGWDPNYPWAEQFGVASEYDWAAAYATVDIESLLQLLPGVRVPGVHRKVASPNP